MTNISRETATVDTATILASMLSRQMEREMERARIRTEKKLSKMESAMMAEAERLIPVAEKAASVKAELEENPLWADIPENVRAAVLAKKGGLDVRDVLILEGKMPAEKRAYHRKDGASPDGRSKQIPLLDPSGNPTGRMIPSVGRAPSGLEEAYKRSRLAAK